MKSWHEIAFKPIGTVPVGCPRCGDQTLWRQNKHGDAWCGLCHHRWSTKPLDSGEASPSVSPESSGPAPAADDLTLPAADGTTAAGSLDTYGVDRAVAEVNAEHPGMIVADTLPLSLDVQRAELHKLQQTLWGDAA